MSGLYDVVPGKSGQVDNLIADSSGYGTWSQYFNGVDVTANVQMGRRFMLVGGTSTGQTVADSCDVRAHLPELATTVTGTSAFGAGLNSSAVTPVSPYCHVAFGMLTQFRGLSSYVVPKAEVQLSATFQSKPGALLAANYAAPNSAVASSLGRSLSGNAPNVTVNLVAPGTMYGDRVNQLDLRIGQEPEVRPFADDVRGGDLQCAQLERCADVQQHVRPGRDLAAAADDPDAAVLQNHRGARLLILTMPYRSRALSFSRALALVVLAELALEGAAWAADQKRVLVLYSTRRDAQIVVVGERELPDILERGLSGGLDYYSEYIDQARFPDPDYQSGLRDFLTVKYKGLRFDVVIAMQDVAADFLGRHRHDLFSDTPVVYFANSPDVERTTNSTGVVSDLNFGGTVALATALQPDVRNLFVVAGAAAADRAYEQTARAQFQPFQSRLNITYLSGLTTKDLESRLAALPDQSAVYYLLVDEDGAGEKVHPLEYLDRVAAVANAPIYSWVDSAIGHGVLGGSLKDQRRQVEAVGDLALRVLRGEAADSIPMSSPDLNVDQVDWRELRRWGVSEARIPAGALVRFREPSAWDLYRGYILGAAAVLLGQTVLIVGLLVQRTRRRQAEVRIRDLGGRLLTAQETERSRIARELHDDISQQMALLTIDLELLSSARGHGEPLAVEATNRAHDIAKSLHDLSRRLHPARLRLIGLVAALNGLRQELSRSAGIPITFSYDHVPATLPSDLTLCVFRVVQEALQNALRHSRAREITVHLSGDGKALSLTIADDGVGFDVDAVSARGLGLISMSERLDMHGGTIEIHSRPGAGTRLEVAVPLRAHADSA